MILKTHLKIIQMKTLLSYIFMLLVLPACSNKEMKATTELSKPETKEEPKPAYSKFSIRENFSTSQLVNEMGLGINLGNALDATGDWINPSSISNYETAWGSPLITKEMIEGYAKAGYSSLRIPVTWSNMMNNAENYRIHPDLLNRVEEILNWTLDCGMVAIINVHHENEWVKKVPTDSEAKKKFTSIWEQLCNRFEKYGDHLLFEPMNEIGYDEIWTPWKGGQTEKARAFGYVNELNQLFVDIVRKSGGNNAKRHLLVEIYNTGLEYAFDPLTKIPDDPAKHLALTVHYYTPPLFAILGNGEDAGWGVGVPSWGTAQEFKELNDNMELLKKNCVDKGIPVVIGEYACSSKNRTQEVVRLFNVSVTEAIYSRGMCPMLWDVQGAGQYERTTSKFKDPVFLEQIMAIPAKYPRN
jgi:endoglucanase